MKNYIFDLYGTLIDVKTDEKSGSLWKKTAGIASMLCADDGINSGRLSAAALKDRFFELEKSSRESKLASVKHKYNDKSIQLNEVEIKLEYVFDELFKEFGIQLTFEQLKQLMVTFRSLSTSHIKLYRGAERLLESLKENGKSVYLLSNAQRIFTEPEIKMLKLYNYFDGIIYSSDTDFQKPSKYFYDTLFEKYGLKKEESVMIGNEYAADITGAYSYGIRSIYISGAEPKQKPETLPDGCIRVDRISDILNMLG